MTSCVDHVPCDQKDEGLADWPHLVKTVALGDPSGMAELHKLFYRGLVCFFREFNDESHDLAQEVLIEVVDAIRRDMVLYPERLCGFVRTVARRKLGTRIGRAVRSRIREVGSEAAENAVDHRSTPEEEAVAREQEAIAERVLRSLRARDREVLIRFYVESQDPEVICKEMGLSETQFRLLKSRAKARFTELGRQLVIRKGCQRTPLKGFARRQIGQNARSLAANA